LIIDWSIRGVAWRGRQAMSERTGTWRVSGWAFILSLNLSLMELIGGVSVNSHDELIGGVSVNSCDFWLSVSVSPAARGDVTPRCRWLLLLWPPPIRQILLSRLRILSEVHHFPASASSSRSTSGEHQRWKSRPPERVSVVGFTCSGEDGRLRFWGVSVVARLLAGEPVAVRLHSVLFCTASSGTTTATKHHHGLSWCERLRRRV
jgi:hypothetical protein